VFACERWFIVAAGTENACTTFVGPMWVSALAPKHLKIRAKPTTLVLNRSTTRFYDRSFAISPLVASAENFATALRISAQLCQLPPAGTDDACTVLPRRAARADSLVGGQRLRRTGVTRESGRIPLVRNGLITVKELEPCWVVEDW
jgi:hypothetical protein